MSADRGGSPSARRSALKWGLAAGVSAGAGLALWPAVDRSLAVVRSAGRLRIGYAMAAPYAFLRADGDVGGESADVARTVARELGVQTQWILTQFDRLVPDLEAARFDVVASGLFITPERVRRVRFSRPTLRARPGWLARRDSVPSLGGYGDAAALAPLRVAALAGTVEKEALASLEPRPRDLITVPDLQTAVAMLGSGAVDAVAFSLPTAAYLAAAADGPRLVALPAGNAADAHRIALALPQGANALLTAVDAALARHVGSSEHLAQLQRYGLGADDLP